MIPLMQSNRKYDIRVTQEQIQVCDELLKKQCPDLRMEDGLKEYDDSLYKIIVIEKQNNNQPLLMYLVDSCNRCRIQRRRRLQRKYTRDVVFHQKWHDTDHKKFIMEKCKGFDKWLGVIIIAH